ncbi:hypothetical protein J2T56_000132 [Natronobacillus azotifigens]|uniref:Uncharacterized protein n=1 Tax=Natronobacillus azotifigens TaxID=472978 RepID=A0A9J6R8T6_9BACI|nr:hypothetical protein [Natronobacillus azotifigens]MCZ0701660.1 hypothetical protein [Natronobacillus azotifigens]
MATTKDKKDIQLSILHYEDGFVYFSLADINKQREDIQAYITELQPKILSGEFNPKLIDMENEEICC